MTNIFWAIGIALAFASWPLVGAYAGTTAIWLGVITASFTVLPQLVLGYDAMANGPALTTKAFLILAAAGIFNGLGVYFYSIKLSDVTVNTTVFVITMLMMLMIWTPLLNWMMNGVTISGRQMAGLGLAMVAVYLLNGKTA